MFDEPLLKKKILYDLYFETHTRYLSSFSFSSIFLWKDFFEFEFMVMEESLCVFAKSDAGTFLYLPPIGKNIWSETIRKCFERMRELNGKSNVARIENAEQADLKFFPADEFQVYKKGYEYYYYREDIAELKGNAYKSKRSSYNHCVKNFAPEFIPFEGWMIEECMNLYTTWVANRKAKYTDLIYHEMLNQNFNVHRLAMEFYKPLGLVGRVVKIGEKICGYTFGYRLNRNVFCVLFEIVDLKINGLGAYIFSEFCKDPFVKVYPFINVMDDFEMENIQEAKLSFHPTLLKPAYVITQKKS